MADSITVVLVPRAWTEVTMVGPHGPRALGGFATGGDLAGDGFTPWFWSLEAAREAYPDTGEHFFLTIGVALDQERSECPCLDCSGSGRVEHYDGPGDCLTCDGSGRVLVEE